MRRPTRRLIGPLAALLLFGCGTARVSAPASPPIPADLAAQVERAEAIGVQLYLFDKAAWIATDALQESIGDLARADIGGYLPFREGDDQGNVLDSFIVNFFDRASRNTITYQVRVPFRVDGQPEVREFNPPQPASEDSVVLMKARQAAIGAVQVTQPLNPVLMPADGDECCIVVYLLAGTLEPDLVVLGKHHRILVDADGSTIKSVQPLSKSALEIPLKPSAEALVVTHPVTDWPLETHVFASLLHKKPIYVATSRGTWRVDGASITFIGERDR